MVLRKKHHLGRHNIQDEWDPTPHVVVTRPDFNVYVVQLSDSPGPSKNVRWRELQMIYIGTVAETAESHSESEYEVKIVTMRVTPNDDEPQNMQYDVAVDELRCVEPIVQDLPRRSTRTTRNQHSNTNIRTQSTCPSLCYHTQQSKSRWAQ